MMWSEGACRGGLQCCRLAAEQESQELLSLAVSGHTVAAGAEGSILFWDRRIGAQAAVFDDTHSEAVTQVLLAMLPALGSLPVESHGCCRLSYVWCLFSIGTTHSFLPGHDTLLSRHITQT